MSRLNNVCRVSSVLIAGVCCSPLLYHGRIWAARGISHVAKSAFSGNVFAMVNLAFIGVGMTDIIRDMTKKVPTESDKDAMPCKRFFTVVAKTTLLGLGVLAINAYFLNFSTIFANGCSELLDKKI